MVVKKKKHLTQESVGTPDSGAAGKMNAVTTIVEKQLWKKQLWKKQLWKNICGKMNAVTTIVEMNGLVRRGRWQEPRV